MGSNFFNWPILTDELVGLEGAQFFDAIKILKKYNFVCIDNIDLYEFINIKLNSSYFLMFNVVDNAVCIVRSTIYGYENTILIDKTYSQHIIFLNDSFFINDNSKNNPRLKFLNYCGLQIKDYVGFNLIVKHNFRRTLWFVDKFPPIIFKPIIIQTFNLDDDIENQLIFKLLNDKILIYEGFVNSFVIIRYTDFVNIFYLLQGQNKINYSAKESFVVYEDLLYYKKFKTLLREHLQFSCNVNNRINYNILNLVFLMFYIKLGEKKFVPISVNEHLIFNYFISNYKLKFKLIESFTLIDFNFLKFIFVLIIKEILRLRSILNNKVIYIIFVHDNIIFYTIRSLLREQDKYLVYTYNTDTLASSTYTNYNFTNFYQIKNQFFGLKSNGIYVLDNSYRDDSLLITSKIMTGDLDFNSAGDKTLIRAYLYLWTSGEMKLKVVSEKFGCREEAWYDVQITGSNSTKTYILPLARGTRGVYWQIELQSTGEPFKLEQATVIPILNEKRGKKDE